jgi:hypothetical protein
VVKNTDLEYNLSTLTESDTDRQTDRHRNDKKILESVEDKDRNRKKRGRKADKESQTHKKKDRDNKGDKTL